MSGMHFGRRFGCLAAAGVTCTLMLLLAIPRIGAAVAQRIETKTARPGYLGDPRRGRVALFVHGCPACPAVGSGMARGMAGPPLDDMGARSYIAGRLPNQPIQMEQWIEHPQAMKPGTAMPDLGVSGRDARDIAAYLATLR